MVAIISSLFNFMTRHLRIKIYGHVDRSSCLNVQMMIFFSAMSKLYLLLFASEKCLELNYFRSIDDVMLIVR